MVTVESGDVMSIKKKIAAAWLRLVVVAISIATGFVVYNFIGDPIFWVTMGGLGVIVITIWAIDVWTGGDTNSGDGTY